MGRKRNKNLVLENLQIIDAASEGKSIAKYNDKVVFIPFGMPGDIVDVQTTRNKRNYYEAKILKFHSKSENRVEPKCEHFGVCGGCKWQHMPYEMQLKFKAQQVKDNLQRIGGFLNLEVQEILANEKEYFYRNKLEFTFCNKKWIENYSKELDFDDLNMNALGFHIPGKFDRVLDIDNCYLQKSPSNEIRNFIKKYADENNLSFFDLRQQHGFLRNLVIRTSTTGDLMLIFVFYEDLKEERENLLNAIKDKFPEITSLMYIINQKKNDSYTDQDVILYSGNDHIMEQMGEIKFKIGPKSFYQTNSNQAFNLYKKVLEFADIKVDEVVYDLYTGTGTIANFVASKAKKVVGVEYVPEAIEDAKINSEINGINNTSFFAGDMIAVLDDEFISKNSRPNVIITDPPRAGMHPKVVDKLNEIGAEKIVYVSCNPATQARDLKVLSEKYNIERVQPVDMFPQTHHVENIVLLRRK